MRLLRNSSRRLRVFSHRFRIMHFAGFIRLALASPFSACLFNEICIFCAVRDCLRARFCREKLIVSQSINTSRSTLFTHHNDISLEITRVGSLNAVYTRRGHSSVSSKSTRICLTCPFNSTLILVLPLVNRLIG